MTDWKAFILILGPIKVSLSLVLFIAYQTFKSTHVYHTTAKVLVNCLALILFFWIGDTLASDSTSTFKAFLVAPAATDALSKLGLGFGAASVFFALFLALEAIAKASKDHGVIQAITVFASTITLCILGPTIFPISDVGTLAKSNHFHLSMGVVIGALCFMISLF